MSNGKKISITSIVCIVCAALLLVSLFLPYASMKHDLAKETLAEPKVEMEKGITNHDLVRISIVRFTRILNLSKFEDKTFNIVLVVVYAAFAALMLLFSAIKKPAGIIVFDIFFIGVAMLYHFDFASRNLMQSGSYRWGMAHFLIYILAALLFVGAIVMIVFKKQERKELMEKRILASAQGL